MLRNVRRTRGSRAYATTALHQPLVFPTVPASFTVLLALATTGLRLDVGDLDFAVHQSALIVAAANQATFPRRARPMNVIQVLPTATSRRASTGATRRVRKRILSVVSRT